MKNPKVSIVLTTFNREKYLSETINSILSQTFLDFELIIVDNYSNYNIIEVINKYNDNRIFFYQNKNNGIIAINRNFGIKKTRGDFIAFCDDDDIWLPNKLELQINKISNYDVCSSNRFFIDENTNLINSRDNFTKKNILFSNHITLSTVLIKSNIFRIGYNFSENPNLLAIEDYDLWLNLYLDKYKFIYLSDKLIKYRIHNNGNSINKIYLYKKIINLFHSFYLNSKINGPIYYFIILTYKIRIMITQ